MEKKIWSCPVATVEQFMPNEYISACFYIACDLGAASSGDHTKNNDSIKSGCGWPHNQTITVVSGDIETGATIRMRELNVVIDGTPVGTRTCYFDNNWSQTQKTNVKLGDSITWVTNISTVDWFPIRMQHTGTFKYIDDSHPLRS